MKAKHPLLLVILDGWGHSDNADANAIAAAQTPTWDKLWQSAPHSLLVGSGECVGLPVGQMGNSEVGHLNMGAGRTVPQDLSRINRAIEDETFFTNPVLVQAAQQAKAQDKALHIMGLLSPGGVHSHEKHIHALLRLAKQQELTHVYIHAFLDGRDCAPKQAQQSLDRLNQKIQKIGCGQLVSLIGRYYAMDRDNRWERISQAYDLLTVAKADYHVASASEGLQLAYARGETDEFVKATSIHAQDAKPVCIEDGDCVVFMNFRADRARALTRSLLQKDFNDFARSQWPQLGALVSLTAYADDIDTQVAFPQQALPNCLGEVLSNAGMRQLRIAETEKYAHVTFFFNGGIEAVYPGEQRKLIPSPQVATYDLQPAMHAPALTDALVAAVESKTYDVIICNYANADMVGHTGNFSATVQAIEALDACLARLVALHETTGLEIMITADHGNAEYMYDADKRQAHTAHTSNLVPFIYLGRSAKLANNVGSLIDVAPTMLHVLGLPQPIEMQGQSLLTLE